MRRKYGVAGDARCADSTSGSGGVSDTFGMSGVGGARSMSDAGKITCTRSANGTNAPNRSCPAGGTRTTASMDGAKDVRSTGCRLCSRIPGTSMLSADELIMGEVPWTKPEVRAVTIAKLDLLPHYRVLDVGAGTGTVTLEIARRVFAGQVLAVEVKEKAVQLITANVKKFGLSQVDILQGEAPACLPDEKWERIFIGGSGGKTQEILHYAATHLAEDGLVVMNTVTLESLMEVLTWLKARQWVYEIVLLQVSRIREIADYSLYQGENPVHVITMRPLGQRFNATFYTSQDFVSNGKVELVQTKE